ncbi:MAG: hypothetical protein IT514_06795 [Burkholderiales bacterium]|nr:hypothetical protein [Burkholderiales bacterium]
MSTVADALETALEATRLLGRWSRISQRHGGGCSCCPGLGDVDMEEVERHLLKVLRPRHAMLAERDSLVEFLRECVARRSPAAGQTEPLRALFSEVRELLGELERIQNGTW